MRPHDSYRRNHARLIATLLIAILLTALLPTFSARAADKPGSRDFPAISRFQGAEIVEYQSLDFDEVVLPVKAIETDSPPPAALLKVEGKVTRISYRLPAGKTPLEAMRNYQQALGSTYKTVFACAGSECGGSLAGFIGNSGKVLPSGWSATFDTAKNRYVLARRAGQDGDVYLLLYAMQETNYPATLFQETVELKPMQGAQVKVLDAATLKRGLDVDGKVAVYGILFDTAKSDIKPESKASLDEMGKLLANNRALKVYIVGHTDNAGSIAGNLELSQRRADAVIKALVTDYKIDPSRMAAHGVASLAPVASNTDDAGRARNRRVEMVVQ